MSDRLAVMNNGKVVQVGIPTEVYEEPKTRFVADFIGEANLLEGTISRSDDRSVEVSVDGRVLFAPPEEKLKEDENVRICVRPERIQIYKSPNSCATGERNALRGTIEEVVYVGSNVRYQVRVGKSKIFVDKQVTSLSTLCAVGDEVVVAWSDVNTILLPAS
jgi:spermidine/putrescine transport system ATP-binding protein